jgi:DNA helicase-2/ATP-dependent DNA helicase PcrA
MIKAMSSKAFEYEKDRLSKTLDCIDTEMRDLDARLSSGIEAVNAQTVEALTRQFLARLKVLILIKDKPYFARLDFTPGDRKTDRLYIGKTTVLDSAGEAAAVDWRAPISTLYYEGRVGPASYTCPDGEIEGEILLKRQFEIEDHKLLKFNDIDITFDDELLKPYLTVNSSVRLKNIIATIQAEQNRIIRADMFKSLIVQGVAGSGKTTVALHRIAYLIYAYAASFKPEEFVILAPNAIFLDYISNILPDLGVENVRQSTFESFAQDIIGKKLKIEDPGEKLGRILSGGNTAQEVHAAQYKSSLAFRDAIDRYLNGLEKDFLPHVDFCAGKFVLCPYQRLAAMFAEDYDGYSFSRRVNFIKERLSKLIFDNAGGVIAKIDAERRRRLAELPHELSAEEFKVCKMQIYEENEELVRDLLKGGKSVLKTYLKKIRLPSALECYNRLISDPETLRKHCGGADEATLLFISSRVRGLLKGQVEYEDLAPLMYIHHRIHGANNAFSARHVVIDEAQDFSAFQFFVVKETLGCSSMTIFGDIAQGIYWYRGTNDWSGVVGSVFAGNCDLVPLQKSYRSTVEIMEQANRVLSKMTDFEGLAKAVPVIRNGEPVRYNQKNAPGELTGSIAERLKQWQDGGIRNIAVICKTMNGCLEFAEHLKKYISDFHIINGKEYAGGLSIVPSYLVKGLEFDAVIISDAHLYGVNVTDIKLLYVAMTRAMHYMDIYYIGDCPAVFRPTAGEGSSEPV